MVQAQLNELNSFLAADGGCTDEEYFSIKMANYYNIFLFHREN